MFDLEHVQSFLATQPDITVWHQSKATPCELLDDLLPRLSHASLAPWLIPSFSTRPLTVISTTLTSKSEATEKSFMDTLTLYGRTLTTLTLDRHTSGDSMKLGDFVVYLAHSLPRLERLDLWDCGGRVGVLRPFICHFDR